MSQKSNKHKLHRHFIAAWVRSPLKVGAALPSSRFLARAMAEQVDVSQDGAIVELGAGTGVVTKALIEAGARKDKLFVIERDKPLFSVLSNIYHDYNVLCADAMDLGVILKKAGAEKVNAIVSSLPFLSMPQVIRQGIQEQMVKVLGDGMIVQFTYGPKSPIERGELKRLGLVGKRVKLVIANVPPANVWVYKKG